MDKEYELPNPPRDTIRSAISSNRERNQAKPKGYRVVAVSLYTPEADWIDEIALILQRSGNPKANRSLVVREAILRLREDLGEKDPNEVLRDFIDRQAKRGLPRSRGASA
jgi:hypothetical protein